MGAQEIAAVTRVAGTAAAAAAVGVVVYWGGDTVGYTIASLRGTMPHLNAFTEGVGNSVRDIAPFVGVAAGLVIAYGLSMRR